MACRARCGPLRLGPGTPTGGTRPGPARSARAVLAPSHVHPGPWTFSTIGSTNGVVVDEIDDWECISGPRMDVFDDWEIKMDVSDDWETENVAQSFKTSTRPTK